MTVIVLVGVMVLVGVAVGVVVLVVVIVGVNVLVDVCVGVNVVVGVAVVVAVAVNVGVLVGVLERVIEGVTVGGGHKFFSLHLIKAELESLRLLFKFKVSILSIAKSSLSMVIYNDIF